MVLSIDFAQAVPAGSEECSSVDLFRYAADYYFAQVVSLIGVTPSLSLPASL